MKTQTLMVERLYRETHPFRLLLILEWILLGIAVLLVFSPGRLPPSPHHFPSGPDRPFALLRLTALISMVSLGLLGLRLPRQSELVKVLYIGLGFGLSWLTVLLGGRSLSVFPALLLVVVMRGCVLFSWSGRVLVAGLAYGSFLLLQLMALLEIRPLGLPLGRALPPLVRRLPPEVLRSILWGLTLNAALLFGLVLVFVLLLVGTVVAEHQSRQELAEANRRLRTYAALIENQATLKERTRIARDIHDSVGHALAAQSIQLENVTMLLPTNQAQASVHLQKARQLGKEALNSVRQSVAALRADPLKQHPIGAAIARLVQDFERNHPLSIDVQIAELDWLSEEYNVALYRITQEALTNIARHSGASHVNLRLVDGPLINLDIQDNGKGFDPLQNTTGFGLQSMRERAEALGGRFSLSSQPGKGCQIRVVLPRRGESR